ncbi:MAG: 3'-5' exonuclease [Nitrospirae bacterium]|nr:3'-5' exonuclease [Nitrospirota bacterium]
MIAFYKDMIDGLFSKNNESLSLLIENADYVVIDTELTGLDLKKDSVVSIGAVRMKGGRIDLGNAFYRMVNPSSEMDHRSIVVHEITPSDVAEKPPVADVLSEFLDFCRDAVIVGHFISMDMDFIGKEIKRGRGPRMKNSMVDTFRLYGWIKSSQTGFSSHYHADTDDLNLFSIAREYGVPVNGAHNALSDAFMTAQLFQRFLSLLPGLGVRTLRDLLTIGRP